MKNERLKNIKIKDVRVILIAVGIIVAIIFLWWLIRGVQQTEISLEADQHIDVTPQQIESIRAIGQWEFLAISNEELVDTTRKGLFTDDHLARIYYGTVRLGLDMQKMDSTWITTQGDSITMWLPRPALLDDDFIDEARTESFYESGTWDDKVREEMYHRAIAKMKERCLTGTNIGSARENASRQFYHLMSSLGYENVSITFEDLQP